MRSEQEIFALIEKVTQGDPNIRAVLLNGSRVNEKIKPDQYQDYDLVFLVTSLHPFSENPDWINVFGERLIMQMPNQVHLGEETANNEQEQITYLMLFKDLNRIDLTVSTINEKGFKLDSLTKVLMDKDGLFAEGITASDRDYWIKKPTQKQLYDHCNEFWWVSTYVIKGLLRGELIYAKEMLEIPVRRMFLQMLEWHIGVETQFSVNLGASRKFLHKYLSDDLWESVKRTYPGLDALSMWSSLKEMMVIFEQLEREVATQLGYNYRKEEVENVMAYLKLREAAFYTQLKNREQ